MFLKWGPTNFGEIVHRHSDKCVWKLNVCFPLFHILTSWLAQENGTQRGQSSTAGLGSIIGALMVLAPRIMRGELDKLPKKHLSDGSVGQPRSDANMAQLQRRLTDEKGIGEDIICDFLHDIPGFTRATDTCRRTGQAAGASRSDSRNCESGTLSGRSGKVPKRRIAAHGSVGSDRAGFAYIRPRGAGANALKVTALDQRTDRCPEFRHRHPERCRPRFDIAAEFDRARRFCAGHHGVTPIGSMSRRRNCSGRVALRREEA